jgi:hypothetical protein
MCDFFICFFFGECLLSNYMMALLISTLFYTCFSRDETTCGSNLSVCCCFSVADVMKLKNNLSFEGFYSSSIWEHRSLNREFSFYKSTL